ncbi:hypothetical protein [Deinococcus humi]|uniref:Uncharacterized protein n=1 Tax=Deinococcus humi TaxID=662880 RepID=A0A7W8NJ97_9DEIO|nr:hypothetical protein [Deinococcus humi]MBB5365912.1 hypothetical protein [Deinococcus humi]
MSRPALAAKFTALVLRQMIALLFMLQAVSRALHERSAAVSAAVTMYALSFLGSRAFAQMTSGGNQNPDEILNRAVCGANGWLGWFTSTRFLVVLMAAGLVGFFIGRAVGKRDNDAIVGTFIAVAGLGAIRILVKIVTTC